MRPLSRGQHNNRRTENRHNRNSRIHLHSYANLNRIRKTIKGKTTYKYDPFRLVVNLSNFNFNISVYKLLGKKLNFCPTPKTINKNILQKEMHNFFRRIKLRAHFGISEEKEKEKTEEQIFKPISTWEPKQVHHTVHFAQQ